jgi:hypothetical protein
MKTFVFSIGLLVGTTLLAAPKAPQPAIKLAGDGLSYVKNERGDRVPDFSTCGYAAGEKEIPNAPVRIVVAPVKGDETERIQRALDYVGTLPMDTNGLRGAVLLLKGRHEVFGSLLITNSGVVLRGQGIGADGTTLVATGLDRRTLIRVLGKNDCKSSSNPDWQIVDAYVPVGATSFSLKSANGLKVGDSIRVIRPSTQAWIDFLGANDFGGGEGGGWKPGQYDIVWNRTVKSIEGNLVTVDAPITTAIDSKFGAGRVETFSWPGRIADIGIENLQLESTFDASNPKDENHSWFAITMENVVDAWVRQVTFRHFAGSAVALYESCQRITVEDCLSLAPVSEDGGWRRNTFFTMGQQTLFLRCYAEHGRHDFAIGDCAAGPNAFVQCEATLPTADSGAIESWASGTLFDNVRIDGNAISLGFRPGNMEGIGWAAANSMLWNCSASVIRCWNPPGAQNWSFGSWGGFEGDGIWRDSNNFSKPESLYAAQLTERTGRRIELMSRATKESSNPTVEEAAALIAASRKPAPQLSNYIAGAGKRNPIPTDAGNAKRIEELSVQRTEPKSKHLLAITNGWIVCDGKLLIGGGVDTAWWRGSIRPAESGEYGPALTRFVPGRIGNGLTDDLGALADDMVQRGNASFDHHYGLWYDIRRDDHERVRRLTGEVIPPFFEQPFARSGQGTAWEGLSKYDLTKFNPWYWSRLKEFANLADERGLVLFNQNYFQHNIIEAGAHWVDCPWRPANNINGTGFPEPPPFAGDKRIFMAEQFYDETNPVRRAFHEKFIRQNLDNYTNNANVIQFTSAEFTGPLHFMQFWLDTVAAWEKQHAGSKPIIALSCTKDVQDAILTDEKRSAAVDVIDFRYWWRTDKGEFAPNGGLNLAPRQFERQFRGGKPNDANLAQMAAEYRAKFPGKAVIQNAGKSGWAFVCAGGSIPELPKTTDEKLLAAIPKMQPWQSDYGRKIWALRESGKQMLVYASRGAELDLSGESGAFRLNEVNERTGKVTRGEQVVQAGNKLILPGGVVWLTKE